MIGTSLPFKRLKERRPGNSPNISVVLRKYIPVGRIAESRSILLTFIQILGELRERREPI
jgi:hypothetical protein